MRATRRAYFLEAAALRRAPLRFEPFALRKHPHPYLFCSAAFDVVGFLRRCSSDQPTRPILLADVAADPSRPQASAQYPFWSVAKCCRGCERRVVVLSRQLQAVQRLAIWTAWGGAQEAEPAPARFKRGCVRLTAPIVVLSCRSLSVRSICMSRRSINAPDATIGKSTNPSHIWRS